jgi:pimeloyl-ACP methyl ester carboxylesterase
MFEQLAILAAFDWSRFWLIVFLVNVPGILLWTFIIIKFLPVVVRQIGQAPLLVAEPSEKLDGGEECEFGTRDGLLLRGTYLKTPSAERRGVIVFGHELNGDRWNATPYVRDLIAAGYDVFTFDFRNHGASESTPGLVLRPWISPEAVADMQAAVDYACGRDDADPRGVGVLAISRAAGAAICVTANESRIRCLYLDGAYGTKTTQLLYFTRYVEIYIPFPRVLKIVPLWVYQGFLGVGRWWWRLRHGVHFVDVEQAARRIRVPTLMIHGERDTMIPVAASQGLRRNLRGPAKLWIVPKAKHNGAVFTEPDEYRRRSLRFFALHLAPRRRKAGAAAG